MIVNLTHYNLDGVVSHLLLKQVTKDLQMVACGYNKLPDKFNQVLNTDLPIIVSDLTLSQNDVLRLMKHQKKVLIIDHHKSSDFINKELKFVKSNITYYINTKFCASANVLKFFKSKYQFSNQFKKLAYLTNDYDLWQLREIESRILNFIFWKEGADKFLDLFKDGYQEKIIDSYRFGFTKYQNEITETLKTAHKEDIEFDGLKVLLIYTSKYVNEITLLYPDYDVFFIVTSDTKLSVRIGNGLNIFLTDAMKHIADFECVESVGFYDRVGGITLDSHFLIENHLIDIIESICTELTIPF